YCFQIDLLSTTFIEFLDTVSNQLELITESNKLIVILVSKTSILDNYYLIHLFKISPLSSVQFKDKDFNLELLFILSILCNMATVQYILDYL
ncbi:8094_t:CDS:1, partial [Scutellospora calospora]